MDDTVPRALYEAAEARVTALLAQVAALNARLEAVIAQADARDAAAAAERAKLQTTVDALLPKIDELLAKKGKKKNKTVPKAAPDAAGPEPTGPSEALANRPQPPAAPPKDEEKKPRNARTSNPPPNLRSRNETSRPSACAHCNGTRLLAKDTDVRSLIDWVAGYLEERIVTLTRFVCADCGKVTAAPVPGACLPKTRYTAAFAAHILCSKFRLHLPWERIAGDLASQGHAVAPSVPSRRIHPLRSHARLPVEGVGSSFLLCPTSGPASS